MMVPMWVKWQNYSILMILTAIIILFTMFFVIDMWHGLWLALLVDLFGIYGAITCYEKVVTNMTIHGMK